MKKIYLLFTLALGFSIVSCNLDTESSSGLPPKESIESLQELKNAVNGVYYMQISEMPRNIDKYMGVRGSYAGDFTLLADLLGSDCYPVGANNQIREIARYQYTKDSDLVKNYYRRFYYSIARVNKVLEIVKANGLAGEGVQAQLGELYALRALFHFDLARMFAKLPTNASASDLGIVIAKRTFTNNDTGVRATVAETYKEIVADLDTALMYLPELKTTKELKIGHFNSWAAQSLRARVYLYMGEDSKAYSDAKYVIDNSPYRLYTISEYTGVWDKEGTSETVLEFMTTSLNNAQRNSLGSYTDPDNYAECAVTGTFKDILLSDANDIRSQLIEEKTDIYGENKAFYPLKYPGRNGEIYVNNPRVIRLSEVYLIAAEASLKSGEGSPEFYINKLRQNRITGYTDVSSVTLDDILLERRLELFAEGHMVWDSWRNKKSIKNPVEGEVNYDNSKAILPIPLSEINISGGKLQQNPNY